MSKYNKWINGLTTPRGVFAIKITLFQSHCKIKCAF